jgi:hypothetical protein
MLVLIAVGSNGMANLIGTWPAGSMFCSPRILAGASMSETSASLTDSTAFGGSAMRSR